MTAEWKTLRVVVEVRVRGDIAERDLRWAVERLVGGAKLHTDINRFRHPLVDTGRVHVKSLTKMLARNPEFSKA